MASTQGTSARPLRYLRAAPEHSSYNLIKMRSVVQVHLGPPRSQFRGCRGSRLQVLIDSNVPAEVVPRSWLSLVYRILTGATGSDGGLSGRGVGWRASSRRMCRTGWTRVWSSP